MAQMEIKKMKQGMSYSCKEKTIILNVFKYFRMQVPDKCVTEIVRRTAKATGCSEKSIFQFRKEEASAEGFREPSKTKIRKNININSRAIKYDNNVRHAIRCIIYDLKYRGIVPSLNTILKQVNGNTSLPNFSLMTLRRLLFDMGFYYEKNGNKSVLVDKATPNNPPQPPQQPQQLNQKPQLENIVKPDPPPPPPPQQHQQPPPPPPPQQQQPQLQQNTPMSHNHQHQISQQQHQVLQEHQRLMPLHNAMMQREEQQHVVAQQQPPPPAPGAPMHGMHGAPQMFGGVRREFLPLSHGQTLHHHHHHHHMAPPPLPSGVDVHGKVEVSHWMHPIVQHS